MQRVATWNTTVRYKPTLAVELRSTAGHKLIIVHILRDSMTDVHLSSQGWDPVEKLSSIVVTVVLYHFPIYKFHALNLNIHDAYI